MRSENPKIYTQVDQIMKETEGDGKCNSPKSMALLVIPVRTVIDRGNFACIVCHRLLPGQLSSFL